MAFGKKLAEDIKREKRIMGQLDPGCMGMINAIIDPAKLGAIGMPVEYLNQSDLLAEMALVSEAEAQNISTGSSRRARRSNGAMTARPTSSTNRLSRR